MNEEKPAADKAVTPAKQEDKTPAETPATEAPKEVGGRPGPDPTRYHDWERAGRCIDF